MNYEEKLKIANDYLTELHYEVEWDDLPDINSLHDCEDEQSIKDAVVERLEDEALFSE